MNPGGDAAEQVVRLSLEGVEVAARISGNGAKNIALLLYAALKEEQKTKGKTAIPCGKYRLRYQFSAKFGKEMPYLEDVPNFEVITVDFDENSQYSGYVEN